MHRDSIGAPQHGTTQRHDILAEPHPYARHVNPALADLLVRLRLDKHFVRGQGCDLYDEEGHRYLDCVAAYGALPFGFNPPSVWRALRTVQSSGEPSLSQPSFLDAAGQLAGRLVDLAPPGLTRVTFTNSGAEAVEAAIKLCRVATGRRGVLSAERSFHGKTLAALSATGNPEYHEGFGAPLPEFDKVPYGDADALREVLRQRPDYYAAVLMEPVQGEGGIVEPPPGYLAEVRRMCTEAGALFVADEIQTGLGRTGVLFACEAEGITPDVMTLAKALGGGLMPIGAVLYTEAAASPAFDLKHSSTFAANTLACRAGLAVLDRLTRDGGRLLGRVRRNGRRLRARLEELRDRFPYLLAEVRGRGYMLGLRFHVERDTWPDSLLGVAAEQGFFTPLVAAYLLNVHGVHVAPTLNGRAVIRIEPPLIFRWRDCEELLAALEKTLEAFADGDSARTLCAILDRAPRAASVSVSSSAPRLAVWPEPDERRFAFVLHPLDFESFADFDPALASLPTEDLACLAGSLSGLIEPFVLSRARVVSPTGHSVYGEFIALSRTAQEFADMPREQAIAEVRAALTLARDRGAELVGLGAFTSVVTRGGLAVAREGVPVTTGNSYTAVANVQAIHMALQRMGISLGSHTTAAIVGATGAIGRAMALLMAEEVGRLILLGNPDASSEHVRRRLQTVSADIVRHLSTRALRGVGSLPGTLGGRLPAGLHPEAPLERFVQVAEQWECDGVLHLGQDRAVLPEADVIVAATSATGTVIQPEDLRSGAIVCDLSRPANLSRATAAARPDVLAIDGGIIALPGRPFLGRFGLDQGLAYACMAETILLTLEGHRQHASLGADLAPELLRQLQAAAQVHGFQVARLRSFGRPLTETEWNRFVMDGLRHGSSAVRSASPRRRRSDPRRHWMTKIAATYEGEVDPFV